MDCQFISLQMPPILYPIPKPYMLLFPKKPQQHFSLSNCFLSSASVSCAALDTPEPSTCSPLCSTKNPSCQPFNMFEKVPTKLPNPSWLKTKPSRTRAKSNFRSNGGIVVLDWKERLKWYSQVLKTCASSMSLREGRAVHGQVIKSGTDPDSHLWVSLINFYEKCGVLDNACQVFDEMPDRDVVSWTALIAGFLAKGHASEGVKLFCEMRGEGIKPNEFTLATALKACATRMDSKFGKQLHAEVIKVGVLPDVYVGSALVDLYAKCGEVEYADKVFSLMPEQNAVSWNALLNGYAQVGDSEQVLRLFCRMKETELMFNKFTLSTVLKGCANSGDLRHGQLVHTMGVKIGCEPDIFVGCSLVDMYSKCGQVDDALKVFLTIKNPDIVTWSAMISCLDQQGKKQEAAELFRLMKHKGLGPNQFTLASLISAATDLGDPLYCRSIHACVYKYGFDSEILLSNALITMYMKIDLASDSHQVFRGMSYWDVVSWNALLSGFHDKNTCDQGPRIFSQMLVEGFKPNMYTFISILRSCSTLLNLEFGKQVHTHIFKDALNGDGYIGTALMDMYAKCCSIEDVQLIFNRLNERDLFTWTVIIAGYAQADQGEKAIQYFSQMRRDGVKPNEFTLASCVRGCSGIASLENGRQLHSLAIKAGHFADLYVASSLADMYGKCGCIDDAEIIFKGMDLHDTVMWNTIICGYSQHGMGKKALKAFESMLDEGALPDRVTFIGILSACSHMGFTEAGKQYFHLMSEVYGITPLIEHYACMVDILGRAGKLQEVERLIENMKLTPNPLIWETVLGACKVHRNVELGERAAEILFQIEPEVDSNYILLSNIFAQKGRWDDVSKVRALMSNQGVKKEPGCSWVEVDAETHVFLSQDASHPRIRDIYKTLDELDQKLTLVGYIPNTDYVLHNVTDKEKRQNLLHHSERLALAFALINNIPNKKIRIFKNLRICGDCHEYMKLISDVTRQKIVVRDLNRFHHFHNGTCSCKDYW